MLNISVISEMQIKSMKGYYYYAFTSLNKNCRIIQQLWKSFEVSYKVKHTLVYLCDLKIFLLGIITGKKICVHTNTCTQIFIVTLSTVAKSWKQPKCSIEYLLSIEYFNKYYYYLFLHFSLFCGPDSDKIMNVSMRCYHHRNCVV